MPIPPAAPRIFVSYARSDGKGIAGELRRRLQDDHGFPLWQDLADMEGGKDWWQQITVAIDHVEYLVMVMTGAALVSPIVRKEWRYARQQGKCVIPVIGTNDIDFDSLPGWMRRTHFVDPDEPDRWRRMVRTLEAPCEVTRSPFMVEDLPEDFVRRPQELESLIASLLDKSGEEPVAITAALKGAGGYGKTTLARAICHEQAIQDAFDDGILWVTLGEQPGDLIGYVLDLIEILTGERAGFNTLDAATNRFAETLGEQHMLIVIDDVWNAVHIGPFMQGGANCARLITTRSSDTLPANVRRTDVDAMKGSEAIELLRFGLPDGEDDAIDKLAARLGEWPLLLKLVNGALRRRVNEMNQPLPDALTWVRSALDRRGLTAFDAREAEDRSQAVTKTLDVSLELLDEDERARFSELAVFPEDVDVPLPTVAALWGRTAGLGDFESEELCGRFFGLSLLLGLDLATRRIRLHDVIRAYLQAEQRERIPILHVELLEAYRGICAEGWQGGPDDGYFYQHLPWHLHEAGQTEELQKVLFDYLWLRRKLEAAGLAAVIQDFETLGTDAQAQEVAAGLRLSSHALGRDPGQAAGQLVGRFAAADGPAIATLLIEAHRCADRPALLPFRPTLTPPSTGLIRILAGHRGDVNGVAMLAERGQALSAGDDGTVRLWDLESGQELRRLEGHSGYALGVAALSEHRAVSAGIDGTVRLWDLERGKELRCIAATVAARIGQWLHYPSAAPFSSPTVMAGCGCGTSITATRRST